MLCPSPIGGDDGSAKQCVERGHCNCHVRRVAHCGHTESHAIGQQGQAMCDGCGAILPDEDPFILSK